MMDNLLISCATISFSRGAMIHGVMLDKVIYCSYIYFFKIHSGNRHYKEPV